ncbi:MAG: hypothetical protein WDO56_03900 [Gammaproteobacteria bacterium]
MSAVVAKLKRALRLDVETISNVGHECWRVSDGLDRTLNILDAKPLTVGAFLRGDYSPDLGIARALEVLADADELLKAGDVTFIMMADTHSLQSWRDQLAASIARAKLYVRGGA